MSWWKYAKPGDKVVCVDDAWESYYDFGPSPERGEVYIIIDMGEVPGEAHLGCVLFLKLSGCTCYYNAACFRPVQPKSTEAQVALLRKHLNTREVAVDA